MRSEISAIILTLFIFPIYSQQVKIDGIDVRQIIIDDTLSVHEYLKIINSESTKHNIKSKIELQKRKFFKPKIKSKEYYNSKGKIRFKVDYGWRGGDSSRVYYTYDTNEILIEAINYNSIFGNDDEGRLIKIEYDELGRVVKCVTKYRNTTFGYNSNGSKNWVEFDMYHYRFSNRRRNESYLADSSKARYVYQYTPYGRLSCIVNTSNDTLVKFHYDESNQLTEKNSFNIWSNRYRYKAGKLFEEDFLEHNNHAKDTTLNETCRFFYNNDVLVRMECLVFDQITEDSIYEYIYNDKGLLSEVIRKNKKGEILKHTLYKYEFY